MRNYCFRITPLIACLILFSQIVHSADQITAAQAIDFIGSNQTVCGEVVSAKYLSTNPRHPTFLNLDRPYPNQIFTALIWGKNRSKFTHAPEVFLNRRFICVTGEVSSYKGKAQIVVEDPSQIIAK